MQFEKEEKRGRDKVVAETGKDENKNIYEERKDLKKEKRRNTHRNDSRF